MVNSRFFYFEDDDVKIVNFNVKIDGTFIIGAEERSLVHEDNTT